MSDLWFHVLGSAAASAAPIGALAGRNLQPQMHANKRRSKTERQESFTEGNAGNKEILVVPSPTLPGPQFFVRLVSFCVFIEETRAIGQTRQVARHDSGATLWGSDVRCLASDL